MPPWSLEYSTAIANGEKHYSTNKPCKRGHLAKRRTSDRSCIICSNEKAKEWRKSKRDDPKFKARLAAYAAKDRQRHPEKYKERMAKFIESRDETYWLTKRAKVHGISLEKFLCMFQSNGGACWICGKICTMRGKFHICIDHCHASGKVRGLLCPTCNKFLGAFKDSPALLRRAAEYLENP